MTKFGFDIIEQADVGYSYMLYQKHSNTYKRAYCFNNSFNFLLNNMDTFITNKAVFGYVLSTDGIVKLAVRHAWNVKDNILTDVTMAANGENPLSMLNYYYLPIDFYDSNRFLEEIERNNGFPCLPKTESELCYIEKLKEQGFKILEWPETCVSFVMSSVNR